MKKFWLSAVCMLLAAQCWALTQTGMPALDELRADVVKNGPISKKLGFSEDQREKIKDYIDEKSEDLVKKRDAFVAAEKKVDRKEKKKADKSDAREAKDEASRELNAARDEAFAGLKAFVDDNQFEALKKWRAAGKANAR